MSAFPEVKPDTFPLVGTSAPKAAPVDIFWGLLRVVRLRQWLKNTLVFAPLMFAGRLADLPVALEAFWTFLSFSLVASAVYAVNDWFDREEDRRHPEKRFRPIASGVVSGRATIVLAASLSLVGVSLACLATNAAVATAEAIYLSINIWYSLSLKHQVILDVFAIAAGFVIRVIAGALAVGVVASHWLLLCTFFLALFLGFAKRRSELELLKEESRNHRDVLASYSPALITQMNVILCAASVVCYAAYTVSPETMAAFGTDKLIYTVPFVVYGLFRYLFLVEMRSDGGNPSVLVTRDKPLGICVLAWLGVSALIIYRSTLLGPLLR
jgi:4-hydroxybenzoate polyprenyltransferase